jgi:hypothetical protein
LLRDLFDYSKGTRLHVVFDFDGDLIVTEADAAASESEAEEEGPKRVYTFGAVVGPVHTFDASI